MRGREAYEADLLAAPLYHDGEHRAPWAGIDANARWSWDRKDLDVPRFDRFALPRAGLYHTAKGHPARAAACAAMLQAIESCS